MFPIHDDTERLHGRPYLNYSLIAINAVVFIWEMGVTGFFSNPIATEMLFRTMVQSRNLYSKWQYCFSCNFHVYAWEHSAHYREYVFLFVFGDNLEDRFGRIKYLFNVY